MKTEASMSPFAAAAPLVCPRPSRLPKSYSLNLVGSDAAAVPVLRKSITAPLLAEVKEIPADELKNVDAKNRQPASLAADGSFETEPQSLDAQSTSASREPEDLALTELLEIISNRPPFHSFSKTAVTTPAFPAIPRHHSSFEPRRPAKKSHGHSYSLSDIKYAWSGNPDGFELRRGEAAPANLAVPPAPTEEEEEEEEDEDDEEEGEYEDEEADVIDALIADLHVARSPSMSTPISASPIPRTQNPMPCNSPFLALPTTMDGSAQGLANGSSLVQGLLARHKALNTAASGRFVGVC